MRTSLCALLALRGATWVIKSAIDAYSKTTGNQAFAFIGSSAFTGTKGEARFSGGVLQMNTGTDKIADMDIALTGVTSFSSTFLVL